MPIIPNQTRTMDPIADHRFTNTINRFSRLVSRGRNVILPDNENNFDITRITFENSGEEYCNSVTVSPGIAVKDDCVIHVTDSAVLDFTDPYNYLWATEDDKTFGEELSDNDPSDYRKYVILLNYAYDRSVPAKKASYVICKNRNIFLSNLNHFLYLGTAHVKKKYLGYTNDGYYILGDPYIHRILYFDNNELDNNVMIEKPIYRFFVNNVDGGLED